MLYKLAIIFIANQYQLFLDIYHVQNIVNFLKEKISQLML